MDGKTIVEFNEITTVESGDKLLGVDISDTSASAGGTNKHFTKGNLLKEYVTLVGEETLTNKTLTSPVVTDVDITGGSVTDVDITGGSVSATTNVVEVLKKVYPVGCIYTSTVSTNPNTLFGFGTWSEYGQGRVLVGKSAEAEFDTAGKTGGNKGNNLQVVTGGYGLAVGGTAFGDRIVVGKPGITQTSENKGNLQPYIVVYFWKREN